MTDATPTAAMQELIRTHAAIGRIACDLLADPSLSKMAKAPVVAGIRYGVEENDLVLAHVRTGRRCRHRAVYEVFPRHAGGWRLHGAVRF